MANCGIFSVSQFAKLSKMNRDMMLNYDRLGLLPAAMRRKNNYRYYSGDQLAIANVIRALVETGMPLATIKRRKDRRTPENTAEAFARQIERIDEKVENLNSARQLISTLQASIRSVLDIDEQAITVQCLPKEAIILGKVNDRGGGNEHDARRGFYADIRERYPDVNLNYPVWALFSEERIKRRDWTLPDRYYFYNPEGWDERPAAQYAIGYARGGYGQTCEAYGRLLDYIDKNDLEICGDTYEEYPLDGICVSDDSNYLIRIMITVCARKGAGGDPYHEQRFDFSPGRRKEPRREYFPSKMRPLKR